MKVLLSNDDGFDAPGLIALAEFIQSKVDITIVAPDRNRSGASNSLTLMRPLRIKKQSSNVFSVDGTPTDCVHLALTGFLDFTPNLIISGINDTSNLGDDTIYSGTVAAAMEGALLGVPAIAISLASKNRSPKYFETAAKVALDLIEKISIKALPANTILNVNVPDMPYEKLKGTKTARLGSRHKTKKLIQTTLPNNSKDTLYWIGPVGAVSDVSNDTDFSAINESYVVITPLLLDLTNHSLMQSTSEWIETKLTNQ